MMEAITKVNNFNLLIFFNLPWNNYGVARIFFNKPFLKNIIKVIKKNKRKLKSQQVTLVSEFLFSSEDFFKIQLTSDQENIPKNLLNDLSFLLIENYKNLILFLKNKEKDIMIITLIKNPNAIIDSDWIIEPEKHFVLTKKFFKNYNLNIIAFHEPEKDKYFEEKLIQIPGNVKIFLQGKLLKSWFHSNDLSIIFSDLKNEKIFSTFSFNINATLSHISNNALLSMAQLIFQHLDTINQALDKFPTGLILQFQYDENEKFQFLKIIRW